LGEVHRLALFENRVLRRIFGPIRDEVTGGWAKLHNEELRDLYSSPNRIRMVKSGMMRWAGYVDRTGERRKAYRLLDIIEMDVRVIGWCGMNWIDV
jgi:hypothetical protein